MGEHADYTTDEQEDLYFDHFAGHTAFPCQYCPYCDAEDEAKKNKQSNAKLTGGPSGPSG